MCRWIKEGNITLHNIKWSEGTNGFVLLSIISFLVSTCISYVEDGGFYIFSNL
jgi:hypothetical protein